MSQPNGKRTTKAENELRTTEVYKMLVAGMARHEIVRLGNEKYGWDVSKKAIDNYIAKATALLEQDAKHRRGAELGKALARLDALYAKTYASKRYRDALAVVHERIELLGLRSVGSDERDELRRFLDLMEGRT